MIDSPDINAMCNSLATQLEDMQQAIEEDVHIKIEELGRAAFVLGYKAAIHHRVSKPSHKEWLEAKLELGL